MIKSVAVFGATSRTGVCVVNAAIKKGNHLFTCFPIRHLNIKLGFSLNSCKFNIEVYYHYFINTITITTLQILLLN